MSDLITSAANHHVKYLRSLLRSRKDRHNERRFVVEGVRLVAEALHGGQPSVLLYVPEQLASTERGQQLLDQLAALPNAFATTPAILAGISDVETPQGIIAALPMPQISSQPASLILMLDGVQDPGNVGTLLRSAEAAGVGQVLCLQGTADVWSPKVVRSGMGVHFRLPIVDGLQWETALPLIEHCPQRFAAVQASLLAYDQADLNQPTVLIIGNEANGVSATTLSYASTITIPMLGALESLNAAVAGSVLLFEAARQRRAKDEG
ncbi:TrmH family RNA methyltransferase [Herpetosiphon llansteffanensis]|uniref:TrmH family RNA methyltransferase n=1 Tax=Herpetosiphon llansteffanensis TaxID=2094568 RepID=UPI000D7CBED0|nr:RNA methyltransferase [Herpetosiphon llansteffanensis]